MDKDVVKPEEKPVKLAHPGTKNPDCKFCQRMVEKNETFYPAHVASINCRSGRHPHCTCDTCF